MACRIVLANSNIDLTLKGKEQTSVNWIFSFNKLPFKIGFQRLAEPFKFCLGQKETYGWCRVSDQDTTLCRQGANNYGTAAMVLATWTCYHIMVSVSRV